MHQPLRHWAWYVLGDDSVFENGMLQFWIAKGAGADDDEAVPFCRTRGSDDVGLHFGFDSAAAKAASSMEVPLAVHAILAKPLLFLGVANMDEQTSR